MAEETKPEIKIPETRGEPLKVEAYGVKPAINSGAKTIRVKSNLLNAPDGGARCALSERHADHPGGEAFIAGPGEFEVGNTPGVNQAIREGRLIPV